MQKGQPEGLPFLLNTFCWFVEALTAASRQTL
jgi:hypothetical protein